ncbi:hypothetical protein PHJA_000943000 [Phtheirospermum japonicum]|uniref:C2 domain-containing protein n=1 Tax=Phtheirospermum japonicum TaxID=374723 RepID=A0A830BVP7_9LAMI|nr:hypothetical protein PHJA_000943000 [Phtheirospermum japonicum]
MLRTFAVAYVHPDNKLTTRIDHQGHTNPTWNYKVAFHVDDKFLKNESSAVTIEIYNLAWLRDLPIGTARLMINNISPPLLKNPGFRRVSLRVCRPSGHLQGTLNLGIQLVDNVVPGCERSPFSVKSDEEDRDQDVDNEKKVTLWRSLSLGSEANEGSVTTPGRSSTAESSCVNGGSELCSDIGPSASIVAADDEATERVRDTGSSILEEMTMEEAKAKGYRIRSSRERWRKQVSKQDYEDMDDDRSDLSSDCNGHSRRNSDGGMFSCFGTAYGIEFRIVCGAPTNPSAKRLPSSSNNNSMSKKNIKPSDANSA